MTMRVTYQFQIRFFLRRGSLIDSEKQVIELVFPSDQMKFVLNTMRGTKDLSQAEWFTLTGGGFPSEEEAWKAGVRAKNTLHVFGVKMKVSLDLGRDRTTFHMNEALKQHLTKTAREVGEEIQVLDPVHGLNVYSEFPTPYIPDAWAEVAVGKPLGPAFADVFKEIYAANPRLNDRQTLALSLYGASLAEASPRARFILLVTTIESLSEERERDSKAVALVERFLVQIEGSDLTKKEKDSLCGSLKWLRYESIGHRGREFVGSHLGTRKYGGKKAKSFFHDCYKIRSDLLHEGKPEDERLHLPTLVDDLDKLVSDLLTEITRSASAGN